MVLGNDTTLLRRLWGPRLRPAGASALPASDHPVRFHFIDGLRGIAAILVVVFHLWHNAGLAEVAHWPAAVDRIMMALASGVDIFFVISGFVIAYSIRSLQVTWRSAGYFALRRQVRLDPPYWVCSVACFILIWVAAMHSASVEKPSLIALVANLAYLQGVLGLPSMDRVAWTLCLEVQFYLVFIGLLALAQRTSKPHATEAVAVVLLAVASIVFSWHQLVTPWFIGKWYLFAMGVVSYWVFARRVHSGILIGMIVLALGGGLIRYGLRAELFIGPGTALGIFFVGRAGYLARWLSGPIFSYFANISYSLYLVHFDLVSIVFRVGMRHSGRSAVSGIVWAFIAFVLAVVVAHCLWFVVERPSKLLSFSLKPARRPTAAVAT